jgi:Cu2+-exporting ATPase
MEKFNVTGMSCAACSARVEKAVSKVDGVTSCSVNLLTNSMNVEGDATSEKIIEAVEKAGYGASLAGKMTEAKKKEESENTEASAIRVRLISSIAVLAVLMYFSMGHMMWNWPLPKWFEGNHVAMGLVQLILSGIVMVINQRFFISGFKAVLHRSPNMDTLVAMGSMASFAWSTYALFMMTSAQLHGDSQAVMQYMNEFYFESAAMILTLITVGKMLEARSKGKTTDALKSLIKLAPKTAVIIKDGKEVSVPIENVQKGDIFVVRPGESIPVDGIIQEGSTAVNEAALTGESIPSDKEIGDLVSAATINQSGFIRCEATRVGEDTTLSQIIKMVSDASATKAPIAKIADKVSGAFVPLVIAIAVVTVGVWLLLGKDLGFALARGISVLVISCPCALGLATPVAIMVGNGRGAKNGILFKTASSLEEAGKVKIAALDKTGTITEGTPKVTDIIPTNGFTESELLKSAYALEKKSEHPLSKAICREAEKMGLEAKEVSDFKALPGNGLLGKLEGKTIVGGSLKYIESQTQIDEELKRTADRLSESGKTPMFFAENGKISGIIAVADVIKEEAPEAIKELKKMGIRVIMLTGDNEKTANVIGKQAGVDAVIAGVLPDGKESVIRELKKEGKVLMVGDGINDAPALTRADIGIAIGAGADIAIDCADIVLMKSALSDVPAAIALSRATLKNIRENLFWAFIYNIIGIPLAAGVWIDLFGWQLNPMFGAAAMSLSSFCVVSNALRLNFFKMYGEKDVKTNNKKEIKIMQKNMKIEGMMCGHCEARVKSALEKLEMVERAEVSHENNSAVVFLKGEISDDSLKETVEKEGYNVISIN